MHFRDADRALYGWGLCTVYFILNELRIQHLTVRIYGIPAQALEDIFRSHARAATALIMMTQADLFIFDDLSSALDVETEQLLGDRLFKKRDVTCIPVSHRRAALTQADHIIVMKDGHIEAEGTLAELLETWTEMQLLWQGEQTSVEKETLQEIEKKEEWINQR